MLVLVGIHPLGVQPAVPGAAHLGIVAGSGYRLYGRVKARQVDGLAGQRVPGAATRVRRVDDAARPIEREPDDRLRRVDRVRRRHPLIVHDAQRPTLLRLLEDRLDEVAASAPGIRDPKQRCHAHREVLGPGERHALLAGDLR